jgi:hypothetical protein
VFSELEVRRGRLSTTRPSPASPSVSLFSFLIKRFRRRSGGTKSILQMGG